MSEMHNDVKLTDAQALRIAAMTPEQVLEYLDKVIKVLEFYVNDDDTYMTGTCKHTGEPWRDVNRPWFDNKNAGLVLLGHEPEGD